MSTVIILSVVCTLLVLLLIIACIIINSLYRETKLQSWICNQLSDNLRYNTDAIRELGDDVRSAGDITLNVDSFMKEMNIQNHSPEDIQTIENCIVNILKRAFSKMEEV